MESILTSVKKHLGIVEEYDHFDDQLIEHINSAFMILHQLGVGPSEGFKIEDDSSIWSDFISTDGPNIESVKTYIFLKVKLFFDPSDSSAVIEARNRMISELEWRLNVAADTWTRGKEQ